MVMLHPLVSNEWRLHDFWLWSLPTPNTLNLSWICLLYVKHLCISILNQIFWDTRVPPVDKNVKIIKLMIFWHRCVGKISYIMLKMSIWNYLIPNVIGKIRKSFENNTEREHDNAGKFWGKNKWKLLHTEKFKRLVWAVSMSISGGYLVVIFLHCLTKLKAMMWHTLII